MHKLESHYVCSSCNWFLKSASSISKLHRWSFLFFFFSNYCLYLNFFSWTTTPSLFTCNLINFFSSTLIQLFYYLYNSFFCVHKLETMNSYLKLARTVLKNSNRTTVVLNNLLSRQITNDKKVFQLWIQIKLLKNAPKKSYP